VAREREISMAEQAQQLQKLLGRDALQPPEEEEAPDQSSASPLQAPALPGPFGCSRCRWSASGCSQCRSSPIGPMPDGSAIRLSRACDVRLYDGLPPHGLSDEQIEEVLEEVRRCKKAARASDKTIHGWRVMYTLRRHGTAANRGDICVIDPRDGQKIFSTVGLERKMGRVEAMESVPPTVRGSPFTGFASQSAAVACLLVPIRPGHSQQ
jgi:hypothetical protein